MTKRIIIYVALLFANFIGSLNASDIEADQNALKRDIRSEYSLKQTIFGNLEDFLYSTPDQEHRSVLIYKSDLELIKRGITHLKALAKFPVARPIYEPTHIERSAHLHLAMAGLSFLKGTNGLPEDLNFGLEVLEFYVDYMHPTCKQRVAKEIFPHIRKNPEEYSSGKFFSELISIKLKLGEEARKRTASLPPFPVCMMGSMAAEEYIKN